MLLLLIVIKIFESDRDVATVTATIMKAIPARSNTLKNSTNIMLHETYAFSLGKSAPMSINGFRNNNWRQEPFKWISRTDVNTMKDGLS